jgi:hypothetical protein
MRPSFFGEHIEARHLRSFDGHPAIVAAEAVGPGGNQAQVPPSPLGGELRHPPDRRARHHHQGDPLADVPRLALQGAQHRGARRTRPLALRPIHPVVGDQSVVRPEQRRHPQRLRRSLENIILRNLTPERQLAPLRRHPLDAPPKLDLLGQQRVPRPAVLRRFVGIPEPTHPPPLSFVQPNHSLLPLREKVSPERVTDEGSRVLSTSGQPLSPKKLGDSSSDLLSQATFSRKGRRKS